MSYTLKPEVNINNILTPSSYLEGNTVRLNYKDKFVNDV
jgi:hypothetical protein